MTQHWIPVNDPPPPDDHHTWARPSSPDCPDCTCCTLTLCTRARDEDTACGFLSRPAPGYMGVEECPCRPMGGTR